MVMINHDYPLANALTVVDMTNTPIEGAKIKIFNLTDFEAGHVDTWLGETITDIEGKWVDPIEVDDGQTYVVHIEKFGGYGPKHVEITT